MRRIYPSFADRFAAGYDVMPDGCWLWRTQREAKVPRICVTRGRGVSIARAAWMIHVGAIPPGMDVCRDAKCGPNAHCVNPNHLYLGTTESVLREMAAAVAAGAAPHPMQARMRLAYDRTPRAGDQNNNAKLTEAMVSQFRSAREAGATYRTLGKRFGLCRSHVRRICKGEAWTPAA